MMNTTLTQPIDIFGPQHNTFSNHDPENIYNIQPVDFKTKKYKFCKTCGCIIFFTGMNIISFYLGYIVSNNDDDSKSL